MSVMEMVAEPLEMLLPERYRDDHRVYRAYYGENPHVRPMGSGSILQGATRTAVNSPSRLG